MKFSPNKVLWLTVAVSLAVHFLIYLWLEARHAPVVKPDAHGVVSVDFIQPVVHHGASRPVERTPLRHRPKRVDPNELPVPEDANPSTTESSHATGAPGPSEPARGEPGAINAFVGEVGRLIDARKAYPRAALRRELEGRVIVAITLAADGALLRAEVETPSPFASLNDAALTAVRGVPHFPPLPAGAGPTLHLHVPIVFRITR